MHTGRFVGTLFLLTVLSSVSPTLAWNKAGHMVSGAMAYADLTQTSSQTLAQVVTLLQTHPHFATKWRTNMAKASFTPVRN